MTSAGATAERRAHRLGVERVAGWRTWELAVYGAILAWAIVLCVVVRDAFLGYRLGRFDLGNMVQAVWSTTQGRPLEMTDASGEQIVRLGAHADPFLVLLAPLWMLWSSPLSLAFAQVAVVAAGALPMYWLARRHLGSDRTAAMLAFAYLAYPWIATSAIGAIHPVTFAITFLLFSVWCLDADRLGLFVVFAALSMSTGELMGLPVLGLGAWYALARGRRLAGVVIGATGAVWTTFAVFVVVPAFAGGESRYYSFYDEVGGSPPGVLRMLVADPTKVLGALVEGHDVAYVLWLGVPLLFVFVLSPALALVALPQLLANGLSDFRSMTDPRYHSVAAIVPFLVAASVFGIARLPARRREPVVAAVLVCCAIVALAVGPWARVAGLAPLGGRERISSERVAALDAAVALVPRGAAVSASNTPGARLSDRRYVYSLPVLGRAEWVVVDLGDPWIVREGSPILNNDPDEIEAFVDRLHRDPSWSVTQESGEVVVFRRRGR